MRLSTAEKPKAEADRVKYLNSSDTRQSAKRLNCSSISIRRTPALCYRTNLNHENRCRGEKPPRHRAVQQPVAVLGEGCRVPHRILDAEPDKPAKQQVVVDPLDQLPLRADR